MPFSIRLPIAIAFLTFTTAAGSPARADDSKICYSEKNAPDDTIRACTKLLRSKKLTAQTLSNTLTWRMAAHLKKGDFDAALSDTDQMIRATPASYMGFKLRAEIWLRKSDLERTKRDIDDAIRLDPKIADSYNVRGFTLHQLGQYDQAIADYNRAIKLNPKEGAYVSNRGNSWQAKADYTRAIADQSEAMRLNPTNPAFYSSRGGVHREMGDFDKALADFDQVTKLNPKLATAYAGRGLIWRARANLDKAIAEFDQAIARDPNFVGAYVSRGLANESKGNIEAARQDFRRALNLQNTAQAQGAAAGVMYLWGERDKATAEARLKVIDAAAALPPASPAAASAIKERRIALVIGNGAYATSGKLANPANDAAVVAKSLRDIGFDVTEGLDLDTQKMKETINVFLRRASTASMAVMFYAGHGMQVDGKNFLVPIDARFDNAEGMAAALSDVDTILAGLDDRIRTNIVILDACRDNPTVQQTQTTIASRSVQIRSGLAAQSGLGAGATIGAGTLVAFATAPGQVALDGEGTNSPFSAALARHIATPGLEVQQMLTRVRAEVVAATRNKQVPWSNSSLLGEVFLVGSR